MCAGLIKNNKMVLSFGLVSKMMLVGLHESASIALPLLKI